MITANNKTTRHIFLGTTPVDRAYLGESIIFKTPQYAMAYSDLPSPNNVSFSIQYAEIIGVKTYSKNVNASNSPVRLDFLINDSVKTVTRISSFKGKLSKIVFSNFDFSTFKEVTNMLGDSSSTSESYISEIFFDSCIFGGSGTLQQMLSYLKKTKSLDLSTCRFDTINNMLYFITYCDELETVDLSSLKKRLTSDDISTETFRSMIKDCPKLKTVDISGIDADFQEILENSDKYTDLDAIKTFGRIFENCPAIEKVKMSMGFFYMLHELVLKNLTWRFYTGGFKTICENLNSIQMTYETLKNLENFEIVDLDDYKDFLEN